MSVSYSELDAIVCEKVMGWHCKDDVWVTLKGDIGAGENFSPSRDMACAWKVVGHIHKTWRFSRRQRFLKELQAVVSRDERSPLALDRDLHRAMLAWPDILFYLTPAAICRAAIHTSIVSQEPPT